MSPTRSTKLKPVSAVCSSLLRTVLAVSALGGVTSSSFAASPVPPPSIPQEVAATARAMGVDPARLENLVGLATADVAINNPFGIRTPPGTTGKTWPAGPIQFRRVYDTLPFDNFLYKFTLTGRDLKNIVRVGTSGFRGIFAFSGLRVKLTRQPAQDDLNRDGLDWPMAQIRFARLPFGDVALREAVLEYLRRGPLKSPQNPIDLGRVSF